jgi:hypothetical protein
VIFEQGMMVLYENQIGFINFVSEYYCTVTVYYGEHPSQDVNIVVVPDKYEKIKVFEEGQFNCC